MARRALLVGTTRYDDPQLSNLSGPKHDVQLLQAALADPGIGSFEVTVLLDESKQRIESEMERLFDNTRSSDTLLIHFSGHGFKNDPGELHFAVRQTSIKTPASTAISAQFLRTLLRNSRAGSKLVMLDCCYSGAVADGFTARSTGGMDIPAHFRDSKGTHVLAAAGATQAALEGTNGDGTAGSSLFTQAVLNALRHAPDSDGDGWISSRDLSEYVEEELSDAAQRPTSFELGRQGPLRIACKSPNAATPQTHHTPGPSPWTPPAQGRSTAGATVAPTTVRESHDPADAPLNAKRWQSVIQYFRDCLLREASLSEVVPLRGTDHYAIVPGGQECLLSGSAEHMDAIGALAPLVNRAMREERQLRYGYPAVLARTTAAGRGRGSDWCLAPLITLDIDVRNGPTGIELVPTGDPALNLGALEAASGLSKGDLEEIEEWFAMQWPQGDHGALTAQVTSLLSVAGIPVRHSLEASALQMHAELSPRQKGAQNIALLYQADPGSSASSGLIEDLEKELLDKPDQLEDSALAGMLGPQRSAEADTRPYLLVTPGRTLNEAQERVLRSAMEQRLTVATGPPGTGKSELVAAAVTTAIAAGQTVLVASTNNRAVDVVSQRVGDLVPGSIIRTGAQKYREREPQLLSELLTDTPSPRSSFITISHTVRLLEDRIAAVRNLLASRAQAEGQHHEAWLTIRDHAAVLGWNPTALPTPLTNRSDLRRWSTVATRAAGRGFTAKRHQRRVQNELKVIAEDEQLAALAGLIAAEEQRHNALASLTSCPPLQQLAEELDRLQEQRCNASADLVKGAVAEAVTEGRSEATPVVWTPDNGSSWSWKV